MLLRVVNHILDSVFPRLPSPALVVPLTVLPNSFAGLNIRDILDGINYATPKNRRNIFDKWRRKYGPTAKGKDGIKLWHPKYNITTCSACGSFHLFHTICRACYKKVEDETKPILENMRKTWGLGIIDQEVQVVYKGESVPIAQGKRIVEVDRTRPSWWVHNLSQRSADPFKQIKGPTSEVDIRTVQIKESSNDKT